MAAEPTCALTGPRNWTSRTRPQAVHIAPENSRVQAMCLLRPAACAYLHGGVGRGDVGSLPTRLMRMSGAAPETRLRTKQCDAEREMPQCHLAFGSPLAPCLRVSARACLASWRPVFDDVFPMPIAQVHGLARCFGHRAVSGTPTPACVASPRDADGAQERVRHLMAPRIFPAFSVARFKEVACRMLALAGILRRGSSPPRCESMGDEAGIAVGQRTRPA